MSKGKTSIDVYTAPWCGHCTTFKETTGKELAKEIKGMSDVTYNEFVDGTPKGDKGIADAGVNLFPTIKITKDGKTFEPPDRSIETLRRAIKEGPILVGGYQRGGSQSGGKSSRIDHYKAKYTKYKTKYISLKRRLRN